MSAHATVQTQHQTVQVIGGSQTRDVMEVGFTTTPSGIYAIVRIPLAFWKRFGSEAYMDQVASLIEAVMTMPEVIGGAYVEDVDDNGLLAAFIDFTVSIEPPTLNQSGPMVAFARVPIGQFTEAIAPLDAVRGPVLETVAALQLTAGQ